MNAKKHTPAKSRNQAVATHDWLAPITADSPCGTDLEYDPEYVVLSAKTIVQPDAQYGNFVGSPEPVNWSDIDRDCRRLICIARTSDSPCCSRAAAPGWLEAMVSLTACLCWQTG
jgi:hypothetical protein